MKYRTMGIAIIKEKGVSVYADQIINENGKVLGTGRLRQEIVKWHNNGRQLRKLVYLWGKSINGVRVHLKQALSNEGKVCGTGGFYFYRWKNTPAVKNANAKNHARRERELGFIVIGMSHPCCDWHHINKDHVVACPTYVHKHVPHVCGDKKLEGVIG